MTVTYQLNNWHSRSTYRNLRKAIRAARYMVAVVAKQRIRIGWVGFVLGYISALPLQSIFEVQPDGSLKIEYEFWMVHDQDAALIAAAVDEFMQQRLAAKQ